MSEHTMSTAVRNTEGSVWVVRVAGEIDLVTAPKLEGVLAEVIESEPSRVLLEFRDVSFLDSSGIRVLVQARRSLEATGTPLVMDGISAAAKTVLEISGLADLVDLR